MCFPNALQAAAQLQLAQDDIVDKRIEKVDEALQELLSTAVWKKRLRTEFSVSFRELRVVSEPGTDHCGRCAREPEIFVAPTHLAS